MIVIFIFRRIVSFSVIHDSTLFDVVKPTPMQICSVLSFGTPLGAGTLADVPGSTAVLCADGRW